MSGLGPLLEGFKHYPSTPNTPDPLAVARRIGGDEKNKEEMGKEGIEIYTVRIFRK